MTMTMVKKYRKIILFVALLLLSCLGLREFISSLQTQQELKVRASIDKLTQEHGLSINKGNNQKVDPRVKNFIKDVFITALPILMENRKNCIQDIYRNLSRNGLAIYDQELMKSVTRIIALHDISYRASNYIVHNKAYRYFDPLEKDWSFYQTVIPPHMYFKALNQLYHHTSCIPHEYLDYLLQLSQVSLLTHIKKLHSIANYSSQQKYLTLNFYIAMLDKMHKKKHPFTIELLEQARALDNIRSSSLNKQNYLQYLKAVETFDKHYSSLEKKPSIKSDKVKSQKSLLEQWQAHPPQKKKKYLRYTKIFASSLFSPRDETLRQLLEAKDTNTQEYKTLETAYLLSHFAHSLTSAGKDIIKSIYYARDDSEVATHLTKLLLTPPEKVFNVNSEKKEKPPLPSPMTEKQKKILKKYLKEFRAP